MTNEDRFSVIHLSTGHMGGAGLAARRLNQQLNEQNIDSKFYALEHPDFQPQLNEYSIERTLVTRFVSGLLSWLEGKLSSKVFFSPLSVNVLPKDFVKGITDKSHTVLHIHNWFNLLNFKEISRLSQMGFPIVITLHDQRTMTGGCHYSIGCTNFELECAKCPLLHSTLDRIPSFVWKKTGNYIRKIDSKFAVIAPSKWILQEAKRSSLLKNVQTEFVPNVLGQYLQNFDIKPSKGNSQLRLGIASMQAGSYVKGGDLINELENATLKQNLPFKFIYLNSFSQNSLGASNFWQSIDYLLVLSRAENSPNVIHEAKQLGIPIIASKIGGITELLSEGFDFGLDESDLNSKKILELLANISHSVRTDLGRIQMKNQFSTYTQGSMPGHIDLYKSLTNN